MKEKILNYTQNPVHHKAHDQFSANMKGPKSTSIQQHITKLIKDGGVIGSSKFTTSPSLNYQAFYEKVKNLRQVGKYDPPRKNRAKTATKVERINNYDGVVLRSVDYAMPQESEVKGEQFRIQRQIME